MEKPIKEEGEEEGSSTEGLAPDAEQALKLQLTLPVVSKFWAIGPSGEIAGCSQPHLRGPRGRHPPCKQG